MRSHRLRVYVLLGALVVINVALVATIALGGDANIVAGLCGANALLIPACIDASAVEVRRRDPRAAAIADDQRGTVWERTGPNQWTLYDEHTRRPIHSVRWNDDDDTPVRN